MEKGPSSVTVLFPFWNNSCKKLVSIENNKQAYIKRVLYSHNIQLIVYYRENISPQNLMIMYFRLSNFKMTFYYAVAW